MFSFRVVRALALPRDAPRVQRVPPSDRPGPLLSYGDICFKATAKMLVTDTGATYMTVIGYDDTPEIAGRVGAACERIVAARQNRTCSDPVLVIRPPNILHSCEGLYYEMA